jgi:hypothetical protein
MVYENLARNTCKYYGMDLLFTSGGVLEWAGYTCRRLFSYNDLCTIDIILGVVLNSEKKSNK